MESGTNVLVVASDAAERRALARELGRYWVIEAAPATARGLAEGCFAVVADQRAGGESLLADLGEQDEPPLRVLLCHSDASPEALQAKGVADVCVVQPWRRGQVASALTRLVHARRVGPAREISDLVRAYAADVDASHSPPPDTPRSEGAAERGPVTPLASRAPPAPPSEMKATSATEVRSEPLVPEPTLRERMRDELEAMRRMSPHEVLGVDADADANAARRAYLGHVKTRHPDRYAGEDEATRYLATEIFVLIRRAKAALEREASREEPKGGAS